MYGRNAINAHANATLKLKQMNKLLNTSGVSELAI